MPVRLQLQVRRFFCDTPTCPKRTFAERLDQVAAAYARKTYRLTQVLSSTFAIFRRLIYVFSQN
jgi:hypothetical protein